MPRFDHASFSMALRRNILGTDQSKYAQSLRTARNTSASNGGDSGNIPENLLKPQDRLGGERRRGSWRSSAWDQFGAGPGFLLAPAGGVLYFPAKVGGPSSRGDQIGCQAGAECQV